MNEKYYMVMAATVAEYYQSDELYLMKLRDGRLIGFASEFEYGTCDIREASDLTTSSSAKWFGLPADLVEGWRPATLEEIIGLNIEDCLMGTKSDMDPSGAIEPI
jgi:hypothetical protein